MSKIRIDVLKKNYINLISIGALLLFPLLQAYSVLRSLGLPSLYFPVVIYLVVAVSIVHKVLLAFAKKFIKTKISVELIIIWGVFLYVAITILLGGFKYGFESPHQTHYFAIVQTGLIYSLLCFLIGLDFDSILQQITKNKLLRRLSISSLVILLLSVALSISLNYKKLGIFQIKYTADYLAISDGIAVSLLFVLALIRRNHIKVVFLIMFTIIMFATISRGSMLSFIGAIICYKIINFKIKPKKIINLSLIAILLIFGYTFIDKLPTLLYNLFGQSRGAEILIGIIFDRDSFFQNDPSMVARMQMFRYGLIDLKKIWFFGSFMRDAQIGVGYIHNWLSFWINYGLIPFILFSTIYIVSLIKCIYYCRKLNDKTLDIVILISFYTLLQIILFRAYVYSTVWFSLSALVSTSSNTLLKRESLKADTIKEVETLLLSCNKYI